MTIKENKKIVTIIEFNEDEKKALHTVHDLFDRLGRVVEENHNGDCAVYDLDSVDKYELCMLGSEFATLALAFDELLDTNVIELG